MDNTVAESENDNINMDNTVAVRNITTWTLHMSGQHKHGQY